MEQNTLWGALGATLGETLPAIFGALAILAIGWLAAVTVRAGSRRLLAFSRLNQRVREGTGQDMDIESPISLGLFWLVLLVTAVAVLNALDLEAVSGPFAALLHQIVGYLPNLIAGVVLIVVAWMVATLLRAVANRLLASTAVDDRLAAAAGMEPLSKNVADVLFWVVILLFIPAILSAFQLFGLLEPARGMIDKALALVPNIFAAALIGVVGWLLARVLRALVANLLAVAGADELGARLGLTPEVRLSRLAGTLVFILVFIPSLIAALDALRIEAISGPAIDMLDRFFLAIPDIIAAAVILVLTWFVAKLAAGLVTRLLAGMGLDALPEKLGVAHAFTEGMPLSRLVGRLVLFFAMLFATAEAANRLGFSEVRELVAMFIQFGADVLLGAVILVIGFWLANVAYVAIVRAGGSHASGLARIARVAILGLVIAMGLRAMGIADDIVNLAFGLTLGAIAVAIALSFGLGGREAAGRQMEYWLSQWRKNEKP